MVTVFTSVGAWFGLMVCYFLIFPCIVRGRTPGQLILKLKVISETGEKAKFRQIIGRNIILYGIEFFLLSMSGLLFGSFVMVVFIADNPFHIRLLVAAISFIPIIIQLIIILIIEKKWNKMPHSHFSHTDEVAYGRKTAVSKEAEQPVC